MRGGSAALVGLAALAALGCRPQGGGSPPPQTVKVSSVQELAEALGPDRVIELAPGEYNLGRLERRTRRHLVWGDPDSTYDKTTPVIRGLRNLTLRGTGGKRVRLVTDCANSWVLKLEDVSGLRLENLELGHLPETPGCWGGVLGITKARGVTIRNCRLFGCGHEGLVLEAVQGLTFEGSVIDRCRASILEANGCRGLLFRDSEFRDNKVYRALIKMRLCEEVAFESCRAEGNSASGTKAALFTVRLGPEVEFKGGAVTGNKAAWLENRRGAIRFEGTDIEGNSFPEGGARTRGTCRGSSTCRRRSGAWA